MLHFCKIKYTVRTYIMQISVRFNEPGYFNTMVLVLLMPVNTLYPIEKAYKVLGVVRDYALTTWPLRGSYIKGNDELIQSYVSSYIF
jgi:hypothetical protein